MADDREKFHAAYREWKQLTDEYESKMSAIIDGKAQVDERLRSLIPLMAEKHKLFMEASKPFVTWKS